MVYRVGVSNRGVSGYGLGVVCIFGLWCVVLFVVLFEVRGRVAGFNYVGVGGDFVLRGEGLVFWSVFYIFGLLVLGCLV